MALFLKYHEVLIVAILAEWLASEQNPYFASNLANIVWQHFFGVGIIEPVDDVRISNPASNPELLETLQVNLPSTIMTLSDLSTYL